MRDQRSVIREGNPRVLGTVHPILHLPLRQHTAAAMDDHGVFLRGKLLGEAPAGGEFKAKVPSRVLPDPSGQLHRADVLALAVVGTALGNEHLFAVLQLLEERRALRRRFEEALEPRHQYGEGGQRNLLRHQLLHSAEDLAVRNHQPRRCGEGRQGLGKLLRLHRHAHGAGIHNIADGLHLREDEPSLRRGFVDGGHEHHHVRGLQKIPDDPTRALLRLGQGGNPLLQRVNPFPRGTADRHGGLAVGLRRPEVDFVVNHKVRHVLRLDEPEDVLVHRRHALRSVHHKEGNVRLVQNLPRLLDPQCANRALVIEPRRVDHQHRPNGQQLHRLRYRVRGRPLYLRHNGSLLPRDRIQ